VFTTVTNVAHLNDNLGQAVRQVLRMSSLCQSRPPCLIPAHLVRCRPVTKGCVASSFARNCERFPRRKQAKRRAVDATVLLGQVNGELVQDLDYFHGLFRETTVTIHESQRLHRP
jgi:hypothetical protein